MNAGVAELCTGRRCAFWDNGCVIEELGLQAFDGDVSAYLLELRARLEEARDADERTTTHAEFARRLGRDV